MLKVWLFDLIYTSIPTTLHFAPLISLHFTSLHLSSLLSNTGAKASDLTLTAPVNREALEIPDSAVYYSAGAPYCVITGTGPVGMRVQELLGKLGK